MIVGIIGLFFVTYKMFNRMLGRDAGISLEWCYIADMSWPPDSNWVEKAKR